MDLKQRTKKILNGLRHDKRIIRGRGKELGNTFRINAANRLVKGCPSVMLATDQ